MLLSHKPNSIHAIHIQSGIYNQLYSTISSWHRYYRVYSILIMDIHTIMNSRYYATYYKGCCSHIHCWYVLVSDIKIIYGIYNLRYDFLVTDQPTACVSHAFNINDSIYPLISAYMGSSLNGRSDHLERTAPTGNQLRGA